MRPSLGIRVYGGGTQNLKTDDAATTKEERISQSKLKARDTSQSFHEPSTDMHTVETHHASHNQQDC